MYNDFLYLKDEYLLLHFNFEYLIKGFNNFMSKMKRVYKTQYNNNKHVLIL